MQSIFVDLTRRYPLNAFWRMGGNTCHAPLLLRSDLKQHLSMVRKELGFGYVRCHGLLNDDMGVVADDGMTFNFERVIEMVAGLLELNLKPFIELSSMPGAFARGNNKICHYGFRSDPPRDWERWYELIRALTVTLVERFGIDEVRSWYFEVWNEPDIPFWAGSMKEYFRLYDLARKAIKDVDEQLRVGGPATSKTNWISEFIVHVTAPSYDDPAPGVRCDFISTHAYPSDVAFLDAADGPVVLLEASVMRELFRDVRKKIDMTIGPDLPLFIGEWNSSAGPLAWNHDECNNAAFVCKTMVELIHYCQGSLYWNISDIYEECGFKHTPFHGGYGLINVNAVPKAAYHAFRLLNELGHYRVAAVLEHPGEAHGTIAAIGENCLNILVWNYIAPNTSGIPLRFKLSGLPAGLKGVKESIVPERGSSYETWRRLGSPDYVTMSVMNALQQASMPEKCDITTDMPIDVLPGTIVSLHFDL